jgi:predicted MFS family arabinose efflux permease
VTLTFSIGMETVFTFTRTYVGDRGIGSTGLFFGVYSMSAVSMRILGGRHYDRFPQRAFISGSLLAYGSGLALMAIAGNAAVIVMAAIAAGVAHGALFPILTSQVVGRARTAERGSAMSIFTSIFDIALLVSAPAVGVLIDGFDYRTAFSAVAVVLGIGALVYVLWDRRLVASEAAIPV